MKDKVNSILAIIFSAGMMRCAAEPAILCVNEGAVAYCKKVTKPDVLGELFLHDLSNNVVRGRAIIRDYPFWHPDDVPESYVERFPRAWNIVNGTLTIVYPDFFSSATADILFQKLKMWNLKAFCGKDPNWHIRMMSTNDGMALDFMAGIQFPCLRGQAANVSGLSAPWYAVGEDEIIVRFPFDKVPPYGGARRWSPNGRILSNEWVVVSWSNSLKSHRKRGVLSCFDGFDPVASVCVHGKNVRSDIADFVVPDKADWLIWERNGDDCRLCQIRDGCWSVCRDAPRQDAPKIIVVNNDERSVFLSYSQEFDVDDVSNSLKRTVAYLKEHNALHPDRPKIPSRNPVSEDLTLGKNCKTNGSETSRLVPAANREKSKEDAGRKDTNKIDTAGLKKLPTEEQAKKGAELYENPETRKEGLDILRKSAKAGSPFALARLSALYYLGEGGVRKDYSTALRLMKSAVAKGFPESQLPIEKTEAAVKREKERVRTKKTVGLGDGYAGRLEPYKVTPELRKRLDQFGLTAGWFRRDAIPEGVLQPYEAKELLCNELPYLLFTPSKCGQKPAPMLVYFGGTGEQGTDLMAHFHQTTIFSMVTSPEFQKKHPCYLFAPMVPKGAQISCLKEWSPPMADLVCDAMYAIIRGAKSPKVDTSRLYLTGLSYGGSAAWTFPFGYPGRFAASIPVAGYASEGTVPDSNPGSFWFIYNEGEYSSDASRRELADIARDISERGGEFRSSSIPDEGHNAWDKAWREEAAWDWMFSKSTAGTRNKKGAGGAAHVAAGRRPPVDLRGASCTSAKPGRDVGTGPERAADGLDATCYVSAVPVVRGDWWQIEFAHPATGRITVKSGYRNGANRTSSAHVEVSSDGRKWVPADRFRRTDGECTFVPRGAVKFLRVVSDSKAGETLVLREVVVQ